MNAENTINKLPEDIQKLGTIGAISYIGALFCIIGAFFTDFTTTNKGWALIIAGIALLFLTGIIYLKETLAKTANRKEALGVLREVFNRLAEASTKGTKEQTVSITMTIDNLPKRILEVIEKMNLHGLRGRGFLYSSSRRREVLLI